jgi:uncharacterized membrane protein HdeD (DUF308 family)
MPAEPTIVLSELHLVGLEVLGRKWGWLCGLGILLVVLGTLAIGSAVLVTFATMVFVGCLMVLAGLLQTAHAISMRGWSGFYLDLMAGVLNTVVGVLIVTHPVATADALTLMIALLLILGGIFRIVAGLSVSYQNRGWMILHGVTNLLLAFIIIADWPVSGSSIIGLFIGIDILFNGWSLIMLGLVARKLNSGSTGQTSATGR